MAKTQIQKSSPIGELVDEGAALNERMKLDALRMAEIKTALIEKGPGEYLGTNGAQVLVIFPAARIAPKPDAIPDISRALGPQFFGTLFDKIVSWKPAKSCRDIAERTLPPAKLKTFLELAEVDSPAQVRFG